MPIRRRPANRSTVFSVSAQTRATIAPTVRQAIRINSHTAVFEHATASHATVSSKRERVPGVVRAHGTATTVGPWAGQFTRGASASSTTCTVPQSRPSPPAPTLTPVIPGRLALTAATTPRHPAARAHPRHHQLGPVGRPPRRTRCPRSPSAYRHPAAHAITSHCARRCPLPWFLTLDKPETLSDNDVRLLRPETHPRKSQKSPIWPNLGPPDTSVGLRAVVRGILWGGIDHCGSDRFVAVSGRGGFMRGAAALSWSTRSGRPALPAVVAREPPQGSPRQSASARRGHRGRAVRDAPLVGVRRVRAVRAGGRRGRASPGR